MEIGILDIPAPLLGWIDTAVAGLLPDAARLVVWGVIAGAASMGLYWLTSPQGKLEAARLDATGARQSLASYDGDFDGLWPLVRRSLAASGRHFGLALGPALLGSLPVLFLMVWMAGTYGYDLPRPGETVRIDATPVHTGLAWRNGGEAAVSANEDGSWTVAWPPAEAELTLADTAGRPLLSLPLAHGVPIKHKRAWWNLFFANPLGSLPADSPIERIDIDIPAKRYLTVGPTWMQGWEAPFILVVLIVSVTVKLAFRIR